MSDAIHRLLAVMQRLRDPEHGCPWDREQTWASIVPHTLEEAYEVADAVRRDDPSAVRDELGDLLFQVVFQARIAEERGLFDFDDVAASIADKLERRHPHVFADEKIADAAEQSLAWERHKAAERAARGEEAGVLDGVTLGLPALTRAAKLGSRAARVGFDWTDAAGVREKVAEELAEFDAARASGDLAHVHEEIGDLLFSLAQIARHLGIDAEGALRDANAKFERRFRTMERASARDGRSFDGRTMEELEALWVAAKRDAG
ncbi:MAG: nucleoside triphosphate pyrophosphohydrolase [Steroidobacteraceae bacterium]